MKSREAGSEAMTEFRMRDDGGLSKANDNGDRGENMSHAYVGGKELREAPGAWSRGLSQESLSVQFCPVHSVPWGR